MRGSIRALSLPRRTCRLDSKSWEIVCAKREESGLPEYNEDKNYDHANITNITKRRLYMLLECRQKFQNYSWFDGTGWTGGRSSKVSFNFLHTLWVYRLCICLHVYEIQIVTNILMSFKISCQVGGHGQKFQNYCR